MPNRPLFRTVNVAAEIQRAHAAYDRNIAFAELAGQEAQAAARSAGVDETEVAYAYEAAFTYWEAHAGNCFRAAMRRINEYQRNYDRTVGNQIQGN